MINLIPYLLIPIIVVLLSACDATPSEEVSSSQENNQSRPSEADLLLHVPSPEWQDQVIYFIFTDRFDDGNPDNNDQGVGEFDPKQSNRFSGGDLQGVIDQLDYIQNMGMTAVWSTPWVENQWWSDEVNYGGYHGYWALDFSAVDPHFGTMETVQQLSDQLHRRGMYLIQDIVVNHTANLFNYRDGHEGYDPNDTAKNFYLFDEPNTPQSVPTQSPFDLYDRNNPDHVEADIYNWTPSILDYKNVDHQYTYQLATLADINTTNPVVIDAFKKIYGDWIKYAGVDAFRIDTVRYVENEFFHHFMHDADGIHAAAKATGRDNFLAFGEVFDVSKAYENDAEKRVNNYMGTPEKPELNSQISFPLHQELRTVFAQGFPTDHLTYRIEQHMSIYDNPYVFPTFIDNHDMARFLSSGDIAGLKQALATILTIPGIPTIYQGTAQAMSETRTAMFKEGYGAEDDAFDQTTELYQFIQTMAKMRTSDRIFTRGDYQTIASDKNGAGLVVYKRAYEGREVFIMMNTSPKRILVNQVSVSNAPGLLTPIYGDHEPMQLTADGNLTTELDGRAIIVAELTATQEGLTESIAPTISTSVPKGTQTKDIKLTGTVNYPNSPILMVKNNQLETASTISADVDGNWQYNYPVKNLGAEIVSLVVYQPEKNLASLPIKFNTQVDQAEHQFQLTDPANDDFGFNEQYLPPQHPQSIGQLDILAVNAEIGGEILSLTLSMRELTDDWIPPNGFDNVAFSIYFDVPGKQGAKTLPFLNTTMPSPWDWDIGHVVFGWANSTFSTDNAEPESFGKKFGIAPKVEVNKEAKTITFIYNKSDFAVDDWLGSHVYITTWDITGEGVFRKLKEQPNDWDFSGGKPTDPRILDDAKLTLE